MKHLMLDLETMGNGPDAAIVAMGACFFNPESIVRGHGNGFYQAVDLGTSVAMGGRMDASTVTWWLQQSEEARAVFTDPQAVPLQTALEYFTEFVVGEADSKRVQVWGNGAGFDNVILRSAYNAAAMPAPWMFWNDRDVRTVVQMGRAVGFDPKKDMPFEGERHNALADAVHQAKYVHAIYKRLGLSDKPGCSESPSVKLHIRK